MIYGYTNIQKDCNDYGFQSIPNPINDTDQYQTEHILEMQLLGQFFDDLHKSGRTFQNPSATDNTPVNVCKAMKPYWYQLKRDLKVLPPGATVANDPIAFIGQVWPSSDNTWLNEFVLLENGVNNCKGAVSQPQFPLLCTEYM